MKQSKKELLVKKGYRVTHAKEFLGLSDEESALIDLKISLIEELKSARKKKQITQQQLAWTIGSSQPRIAMLERGHPDVSLDLICRALFALGLSNKEIAKVILSGKAA